MALIHKELHKGGELDTLNISNYIEELADNLLSTYRVGNNGIILDTILKKIFSLIWIQQFHLV